MYFNFRRQVCRGTGQHCAWKILEKCHIRRSCNHTVQHRPSAWHGFEAFSAPQVSSPSLAAPSLCRKARWWSRRRRSVLGRAKGPCSVLLMLHYTARPPRTALQHCHRWNRPPTAHFITFCERRPMVRLRDPTAVVLPTVANVCGREKQHSAKG